MDLAYLSGQRPGDVLRFTQRDIVEAAPRFGGKDLQALGDHVNDPDSGARTELGRLLDRIGVRTVRSLLAISNTRWKKANRRHAALAVSVGS